MTDATTCILHTVHHAGSENEILKYILIAQLDRQWLYVQLHIWRELRILKYTHTVTSFYPVIVYDMTLTLTLTLTSDIK